MEELIIRRSSRKISGGSRTFENIAGRAIASEPLSLTLGLSIVAGASMFEAETLNISAVPELSTAASFAASNLAGVFLPTIADWVTAVSLSASPGDATNARGAAVTLPTISARVVTTAAVNEDADSTEALSRVVNGDTALPDVGEGDAGPSFPVGTTRGERAAGNGAYPSVPVSGKAACESVDSRGATDIVRTSGPVSEVLDSHEGESSVSLLQKSRWEEDAVEV
ncbi:MAG: hypothetical protein KTR25_08190 [Myxococcales bacterium]|nr:hypothetical protein [Myxococcales bacterium]